MCIELTVSVVTFIYKDHFLSGLEERLANGLVHHYGYKNSNEKYLSFSEAVDFAQYKVRKNKEIFFFIPFYTGIKKKLV